MPPLASAIVLEGCLVLADSAEGHAAQELVDGVVRLLRAHVGRGVRRRGGRAGCSECKGGSDGCGCWSGSSERHCSLPFGRAVAAVTLECRPAGAAVHRRAVPTPRQRPPCGPGPCHDAAGSSPAGRLPGDDRARAGPRRPPRGAHREDLRAVRGDGRPERRRGGRRGGRGSAWSGVTCLDDPCLDGPSLGSTRPGSPRPGTRADNTTADGTRGSTAWRAGPSTRPPGLPDRGRCGGPRPRALRDDRAALLQRGRPRARRRSSGSRRR